MADDLPPRPDRGFRFSGTLLDIIDRVEYARVDLADLNDPTFRLRYEAYTREGYMPFNDEQVATDAMDQAPNVLGFGVFIDKELVASIRFHHLTAAQPFSPSMSIYSDILQPLLDQGASFIDPTRLTCDHEASLAYPALPFLALRIAVMAATHYDVTYNLSSVRPQHVPFYRRVFFAEEMGGVRYYPGLNFPCVMLATRSKTAVPQLQRRYPIFISTPQERQALFGPLDATGRGQHVKASARLGQPLPLVEEPA